MTSITDKVTLYFTADKSTVERRGRTFLVRRRNEEKGQKIPAIKIKDFVVVGHITLDSRIIGLCREELIPIHFLSNKWEYQGTLQFNPTKNLFIRRAQIRKHFDTDKKLDIAKKIVTGKIHNQQSLLDRYRLDLKLEYTGIDTINNIEALRGIEGNTSRQYFSYFSHIIKNQDFHFVCRSKRPPENEVNALMSFMYSVLFNEIYTTTLLVGLDPAFGYLHDVYYGRPSLICDLIEEWRPLADRFVFNLINRTEISLTDFRRDSNWKGIWLNNEGYTKVIKKWYKFFKVDEQNTNLLIKPITYQYAVERQVRLFSQYLMDDKENYKFIKL